MHGFGWGCGNMTIFEKVRYRCGGLRLLINYYIYFYFYFLYIAKHIFFSYNGKQSHFKSPNLNMSQIKLAYNY